MLEYDDPPFPSHHWLVIPYFKDDKGRKGIERPLPANVSLGFCSSIQVNGKPIGIFTRGIPMDITVDVIDYGTSTGNFRGYVRVYWTDATTALSGPLLLCSTTFTIPTMGAGPVKSPIMKGTIPLTASTHVCLMAEVYSDYDNNGAQFGVGIDRHWAQLNLSELTVASDGIFSFDFNITNPAHERLAYDIIVEPVSGQKLVALNEALNDAIIEATSPVLDLVEVSNGHSYGTQINQLSLEPDEVRGFRLDGIIKNAAPSSRFAFEVLQYRTNAATKSLVGSLNVIVQVG